MADSLPLCQPVVSGCPVWVQGRSMPHRPSKRRRDNGPVASANLDFVRSIREAWERGDYSSAKWADPEVDFMIADGPSPGSWTGLAEMAEGLRDWLSAWEEARSETDEYRDLDEERVLVLARFLGRGKAS